MPEKVDNISDMDDDTSIASELSSVQHRIYLLKNKKGKDRIEFSSNPFKSSSYVNTSENAKYIEGCVNEKMVTMAFDAWCKAYKATAFRHSNLTSHAFHKLQANLLVAEKNRRSHYFKSKHHPTPLVEGGIITADSINDLGSTVSELTCGLEEEEGQDYSHRTSQCLHERIKLKERKPVSKFMSDVDTTPKKTDGRITTLMKGGSVGETITTPRASILRRHRVQSNVFFSGRSGEISYVHKESNRFEEKHSGRKDSNYDISEKCPIQEEVVHRIGTSSRALSSLWYEYEQQFEDKVVKPVDDASTVESADVSLDCGVSDGNISKSSTDSLYEVPPILESTSRLSQGKAYFSADSDSSADGGVGILCRSQPQIGEGNSGTGDENREVNVAGMLISHGRILPSRDGECQHSTSLRRYASPTVGGVNPPSPTIKHKAIDMDTLRSLSSIKVKKQTSSMRRQNARAGASEKSSRNLLTAVTDASSQRPFRRSSLSPPPPPSSSPSLLFTKSDTLLSKHNNHANKHCRSLEIFDPQRGRNDYSLHDNYYRERITPTYTSENVDAYTGKNAMSRLFRKWYMSSKFAASLRLMADDHFFKRRVFTVYFSLRRAANKAQDVKEAHTFFCYKMAHAFFRCWAKLVSNHKDQREIDELMQNAFLRKLMCKYLLKLKVNRLVERRARVLIIHHFASLLHHTIRIWKSHVSHGCGEMHNRVDSLKLKELVDIPVLKYTRSFNCWRNYFHRQCVFYDIFVKSEEHFRAHCGHLLLHNLEKNQIKETFMRDRTQISNNFFFHAQASKVFLRLKCLSKRKEKQGALERKSNENRRQSWRQEEWNSHRHSSSRHRNMSIFSKCFVRENNTQDLRELFDKIDTDGSGTIDFDELYNATAATFPSLKLTPEDVYGMIENADLNDDGVIDFQEFCIIMREAKDHVKTRIAATRRRFGASDFNRLKAPQPLLSRKKDGVSQQDYSPISKRTMVPLTAISEGHSVDTFSYDNTTSSVPLSKTSLSSRSRNMSIFSKCFVSENNAHDLRELFDKIDTDGSGTIDFDELYNATAATFPSLKLTPEDVYGMIENADLNDDGVIDFQEFCIIMREAKDHLKTRIATTRRKFRDSSSHIGNSRSAVIGDEISNTFRDHEANDDSISKLSAQSDDGTCRSVACPLLTLRWVLKWKSYAICKIKQEMLMYQGIQHLKRRSCQRSIRTWKTFVNQNFYRKERGLTERRRASISYNWYKEKNIQTLNHVSSVEKKGNATPNRASDTVIIPRSLFTATEVQEPNTATEKTQKRGQRLSILFQRLSSSQACDELHDDEHGEGAIDHADGRVGAANGLTERGIRGMGSDQQDMTDSAAAMHSNFQKNENIRFDRRSSVEMDAVENVVRKSNSKNLLRFCFREWFLFFRGYIHWKQQKKYIVMQRFYRQLVTKNISSKLNSVADSMFRDNRQRYALKRWYIQSGHLRTDKARTTISGSDIFNADSTFVKLSSVNSQPASKDSFQNSGVGKSDDNVDGNSVYINFQSPPLPRPSASSGGHSMSSLPPKPPTMAGVDKRRSLI